MSREGLSPISEASLLSYVRLLYVSAGAAKIQFSVCRGSVHGVGCPLGLILGFVYVFGWIILEQFCILSHSPLSQALSQALVC